MKLVYDIASCPKGLDVANFTKIFEQHHVVFWDSTKGGTKPRLYSDKGEELPLAIVDMDGKELDIEMYTKAFKDKEFWEKELHYCKNSPIYYYSNYLTPEFPARSEDISAYLLSLGLEDLEQNDSDTAADKWEAQKARLKEVSAGITIEELQERRGVLEVLKAEFERKIKVYEESLKDVVSLFDVNGAPHPDKVRVNNLVGKIRSSKNIPEKYADKYKNVHGRWDGPMLYQTTYPMLLEIYHFIYSTTKK